MLSTTVGLGRTVFTSCLLLGGLLFVAVPPGRALTVASSTDAEAMAAKLIGPGINLVPGSAVYTGAANASGFFDGDTSLFGSPSGVGGVLLTSGSVANALPPNGSESTSANNGFAGSADLDALVSGLTYDASSLSFRVKLDPGTSGIQWKYVFGSEEYTEYVGSQYNDVFGLFLDGVNLALLPGGSTAVSINTVNGGLNSTFYRNNEPFSANYESQYDGLTTVLTSLATGLNPGQEYALSFQIADRGDRILDSGVFLQAGSIKDPVTDDVPAPLPALGVVAALTAARRLRQRLSCVQL